MRSKETSRQGELHFLLWVHANEINHSLYIIIYRAHKNILSLGEILLYLPHLIWAVMYSYIILLAVVGIRRHLFSSINFNNNYAAC